MNFFNSIKFRFTLWYLTILGAALILLGTGIYLTLSDRLHKNLDHALKTRAEQLVGFRDIMAIVGGGTFEEEPGEAVSFYYYSGGGLTNLSQKGRNVPAHKAWIERVLAGESGFVTVNREKEGPLRIYAMPYTPENSRIRLDQFEKRGPVKPRDPPEKRRGAFDGRPRPWDRGPPPREPGSPPGPPPRPPRERAEPARPDPPERVIEVHRAAIMVARPAEGLETALSLLFQILLMALPATLILAGGGGVFLLRRALKPVEQITDVAREIEENDLSRRIKVCTKDELGRLSSTLNLMIERLERAFKRQKELTGDASHELRAPLAVIQAEATLALQRERDPESYRRSLEIVARETDHMSGTLKQLLTLARSDSGKEQMIFRAVELSSFLTELCEDMTILCRKKNQTLHQELHDPLTIKGDPQALRNMMVNLLTNAIRYTPEGERITVSLYREKSTAFIAVSDTGIGIPPEALPFIFKRFYRVDKARSRDAGGSGLGLAICKHIALAHGGTIQVESRINQGSTFRVCLPLHDYAS
ncbi:MAG: HAMP domain-containing protein [Deltaproteobacteria bacterium]|nr:HAMP domain-containing protein [Deltaproteobacteria bacterium]